MKITSITDVKVPELLSEAPRKSAAMLEPIKQPIGISDEEFTPEYQARLRDYQQRRPDLYHKIVNGH